MDQSHGESAKSRAAGAGARDPAKATPSNYPPDNLALHQWARVCVSKSDAGLRSMIGRCGLSVIAF